MKQLLLAAALLSFARPAAAQEAIYIVRHAERADQSADSGLSTKGVGRAYQLRDLLHDAGITSVITTELQRTIETAKPLADARHLTPVRLAAADAHALVAGIAASGARDRDC